MSTPKPYEVPMQLRLESRQEFSFNPGKVQLTFVRVDGTDPMQFSYFDDPASAFALSVGTIYEMSLTPVPPEVPAE